MRKKGFSLAEMLVALFISAVIIAAIIPIITAKKTNGNFENNTVKCIKAELAADLNSAACQNTIKYVKYNKMGAVDSLIFFADNGAASEQTAARSVLKAACDAGAKKACNYFMENCKKDSDQCDVASSTDDLDHYLKLLVNDSSVSTLGRMKIRYLTEPWYDLRNDNIDLAVDKACCTGSNVNTACDIVGSKCLRTWSWGHNDYGQLGDNTTIDSGSPVKVVNWHIFTSIAAGVNHTCGIDTLKAAWCWGYNWRGSLGDNTYVDKAYPVRVAGGHSFTSITAGADYTCALDISGAAWCWGGNYLGELGDGTNTDRYYPIAVVGGHTFSSITTGYTHTCGIDTAGAAWCWGDNNYGELGDTTNTIRFTPVKVKNADGSDFSAMSAISGGGAYTCGIEKSTGKAWCWGANSYGGLGDTTTVPKFYPVKVKNADGSDFSAVSAISAGGFQTCAIEASSGKLWCWGDNWYGVLGDLTTNSKSYPVKVLNSDGSDFSATAGSSISAISVGRLHACALDTSGAAWCWGNDWYGQIGDGATPNPDVHSYPLAVTGGRTFTSISAGQYHTVAIDDGT